MKQAAGASLSRLFLTTLMVIGLAAVGCGGDTTGPVADLTGMWSGSASDNTGPGTLTFLLTQQESNVSGSFTARDNASGASMSGSLEGTISSDGTFKGDLWGDFSICAVTVKFTSKVSSSSMKGTYSGTNSCSGSISNGQFNLQKS